MLDELLEFRFETILAPVVLKVFLLILIARQHENGGNNMDANRKRRLIYGIIFLESVVLVSIIRISITA